jgi:hypothetical protein
MSISRGISSSSSSVLNTGVSCLTAAQFVTPSFHHFDLRCDSVPLVARRIRSHRHRRHWIQTASSMPLRCCFNRNVEARGHSKKRYHRSFITPRNYSGPWIPTNRKRGPQKNGG